MTDINSALGVPPKPEGPPSYNAPGDAPGAQPFISSTPNRVIGKRRWLGLRSKTAGRANADRGSNPASPRGGGQGRRSVRIAWYWTAAAAVLFLIGGLVLGATLPDPKKSKEFIALQSEKDGVSADLAKLQSRYNTLNSSISGRESTISTKESAITVRESAVKSAEENVKKREEAVTAAEKTKAANTIREGTWTVGKDIEPGTYRTTSDVSGSCYWGIYRTGSNGSDIVDNDIVTGGRPSVTLSAGQDFKSSRCGSWSKQ